MEVDYEVDEDVADWAEDKEEAGGAVTVTRAADDADVGDADFDPLDAPSMRVSPGRSVELLAGAAPKAGPRRRVLAKDPRTTAPGTVSKRDISQSVRGVARRGPNGAEMSALLTTGDAADTHLAKAGRHASPSRHETSVGNEEDLREDADLDGSEEANVADKTIACEDDVQDSRRQGGGLDDEAERKSEASTEWQAEQDSQDPQFVTRVRELILGVYERKNPTKLSKVPALLEKYAGAEFKMYQRICKKYGEPVAVDASWRPGETVKRRRTASCDVRRSGAGPNLQEGWQSSRIDSSRRPGLEAALTTVIAEGDRGEDPWSGPHSMEQMRRSALRAQRVLARVAMKRAAVLAAAAPTAPLSPSLAPATSAKQPPPPPPPRGFAKKAAAPRPPDSLRPGSEQPKDATTHRTDSSAAEDEDEEFEGGWPFKESFSPNSASTCSDVADDDEDDQAARRSPSQASSKASRASQASKPASKASHGSKSAPPSALPVVQEPADASAAVPSAQQEPSLGRGDDTDDSSSVGAPPASPSSPQSACGGDLDAFRQKYNTIFGTLPAASLGAEDSKRSASSSPKASPRSPPGAWRRRDERDLMPGANRIRPQLGRPPIPPAPPPPGPEAWRSQGSPGHAVWREDSWRRDIPDSAAGRSGVHGLLSRPPAGAPMFPVMPWEMEAQRGGLRPAGPGHGSPHWSRSNWR
uniref:Uncharacterized protein n=1 Tax=Noctiluca scintillans TaxID=2966 RepID=A0A7S1F9U3_NOCSC